MVRGGRRRQCEAVSEDRLAAKLDRVTERPGGPGRLLPVGGPASGRAGLVAQARRHPAAAVRAVRLAGRLGAALAAGQRGDLYELMALVAAYSGLRQGELFALTAAQVDPAGRVIDVGRKGLSRSPAG